ncbi:NAD(P)-dependent oxidoreductase [uncultured Finegoldia sp.]|uniref:NAD(P)-dependent oxidoreductase n=1 Tax=uncultured Finegoldia sp. TaxID=328009 RepID=UPI0026299D98|nr:NAD(P)-dependent oxidoreductase [uncultured Finegoldia sp.]
MKVLITNKIPDEIIEKYNKNFEVDYNDSLEFLSKEQLKQRIKTAQALVCPLSEKIDREIIDAAQNLKIIANYGAGFDNIDVDYATEKNITVTNAPSSASIKSTAEFTIGLIIDLLREITKMNGACYDGSFKGWKPVYGLSETLEKKTLGIIGMGRIGTDVMRKAKAFDMDVIFYSRSKKNIEGAKQVELDYLLKNSDVVSLHTSYSEKLYHFIDKNALSKMKNSAYLINTARGKVVNQADLIDALNAGQIAGAALDVYEFEPEISDELKNAKNILLAPHLGNATKLARIQMGDFTFENIMQFKNGEIPKNKVN